MSEVGAVVVALAVGLLLLFRPHSLDPEHFPLVAAGFLIAAVCPGAPYGPPFTRMAGGNVEQVADVRLWLRFQSAPGPMAGGNRRWQF